MLFISFALLQSMFSTPTVSSLASSGAAAATASLLRLKVLLDKIFRLVTTSQLRKALQRSPYTYVALVSLLPILPFVCLGPLCVNNLLHDPHHIPKRLSALLAFAAGALLSEAFENFLPEAYFMSIRSNFFQKSHNHHSLHNSPGTLIIVSIFFFFFIELAIRIFNRSHYSAHNNIHSHSHETQEADHLHTTDVAPHTRSKKDASESKRSSPTPKSPKSKSAEAAQTPQTVRAALPLSIRDFISHSLAKLIGTNCSSTSSSSSVSTKDTALAMVGLASDFLHNMTDGIAIGLSHTVNPSTALISTTLSIIAHELPHELTDMAILLRSGATYRQALYAQILTASGAFLGCFLIRQFGHLSKRFTAILLSLTGGGFVYIAVGEILPQLRHHVRTAPHLALVSVAFLMGLTMHLVVASH
ncbi:MAG: hypothetical protein MHMPM18_001251 [Marteilia pararefringens]